MNRVESRANTVRPLGQSIRGYLVAISVVALPWPLGLMAASNAFPVLRHGAIDYVGTLVLGVAFLILGAMSLSLYLLDIVRGLMLARMDTRQLKRRLAKATPSESTCPAQHLRGAKVGAWFFGLSTLVVFVALVVRMLAGGIRTEWFRCECRLSTVCCTALDCLVTTWERPCWKAERTRVESGCRKRPISRRREG